MGTSFWRIGVIILLTWVGFELHALRVQAPQFEAHPQASLTSLLKACLDESAEPRPPRALFVDTASPSASPGQAELLNRKAVLPNLAPPRTVAGGSVGQGAHHSITTRSGGYPQYGNSLHEYLITAPIADGQFDVGATFWTTASSLNGGSAAAFGAWIGANSPGQSEPFMGGSTVGLEINAGNRYGDFGLQTDVGGNRYTVGLQLVPDVVPTSATSMRRAVVNRGSPGTVTSPAHGLTGGTPVYFSGSGTLPGELTAGATYYVSASGLSVDAFRLARTIGGPSIDFASSSTGSVHMVPSFPGSFALMIGPSVHAHRWHVGSLLRNDTIMPGGYAHYEAGASAPAFNLPQAWTAIAGHWVNGLDFSRANFSGAPMVFSAAQTTVSATDGGSGVSLPAHVYKYVKANIAGREVVWPVYLP